MSGPLDAPKKKETTLKRVAILFAGGPAPAANAVISTAAASFLRNDIEVLGIMHGYSSLVEYSPEKPLVEGDALRQARSGVSQADAQHARHHDRHGPHQPGQERLAPVAPRRSRSSQRRCAACTKRSARSESMR